MFYFGTFHQEIHLNPGGPEFLPGRASPSVCFSDIRGSETPIFLMDIMMIYTAIVFPGNLRGILILKTWCLDAYLRYTDTCSTPLPGFDPEPWFTSFKLPKKNIGDDDLHLQIVALGNFQAPGVFCLGSCICCQAQNFGLRGKCGGFIEVYW